MDLVDGLGLGTLKFDVLFAVADAGILGGGMLSCFGGWGPCSAAFSFAA